MATAGGEDVEIVLDNAFDSESFYPGQPQERIPLVGKPLPMWDGLAIEVEAGRIEGMKVVVCFFDSLQRPSRHAVKRLAERAEEWAKDVAAVVLVDASGREAGAVREWAKEQNIALPMGSVSGILEKVLSRWGVEGLPWVIVADEGHIVRAEGLRVDEVEEAIRAQ